ncbi:MAG: DUF4417 domain-containing protein [Lepagella sp.]
MINKKTLGSIPLVLPGMEEYAVPLPSSEKVEKKRTPRDLYNLRLLERLESADIYGFPKLKPWTPSCISKPIAFHEARAYYRKHHSLSGYFVHFFINDEFFDCIRKNPERYLAMFKSADFIIAPDFSTYRNYPFPILVKNVYDNLLLASYFQCNGCNIVANAVWSLPIYYDLTFKGQPTGGAICVSSKSLNLRDKKGVCHWLHGYSETIKRLAPESVIRIGKIIPGEEKIFANPIRREVSNPYIERRRNGR